MLRTDAITKCRVIQKIDKTLNNSTHTAKQKRTDRHNLHEVNRVAIRHLHISHNTPCLPPSPLPAPQEKLKTMLEHNFGGKPRFICNERCANGESIDRIRESEKCTEYCQYCGILSIKQPPLEGLQSSS